MAESTNVLFIIWDACRAESVKKIEEFSNLAQNNIRFNNAFAPTTWSLTSHASIFSGSLPSEHGICTGEDNLRDLPLTTEFTNNSYDTFAVSANIYASHYFGFDAGFDEFVYSLTHQDHRGLDVEKAVDDYLESHPGASEFQKIKCGLAEAIKHEKPAISLYNFVVSAYEKGRREFPEIFRYLNSRRLANSTCSYRPKWNTEIIERVLRQQTTSEGGEKSPFFMFSNYMSPHHPYLPDKEHQSEPIHSWTRLKSFNEEYGHPFSFIEHLYNDSISEEAVTALRNAYYGEVKSVGTELSKLLDMLSELGELEDTLIVITSDHGEMLGETGPLGERRMGHIDSISDHLLKVPLLIAHPEIEGREVSTNVSLHAIYDVLVELASGRSISTEWIINKIVQDSPTVDQRPTRLQGENVDSFNIPESVKNGLKENYVVICEDDWRVIHNDSGETRVWKGHTEMSPPDAPEELISYAKQECEDLVATVDSNASTQQDLSKGAAARLEDLGYR